MKVVFCEPTEKLKELFLEQSGIDNEGVRGRRNGAGINLLRRLKNCLFSDRFNGRHSTEATLSEFPGF